MNLKLNVKRNVKIQIYFGIMLFILIDLYGLWNHYFSLDDPISILFFLISFLPIAISLKHYLRTYEVTLSGIRFINVLGQEKLIPYNELYIEAALNDVGQKCLVLHYKEKKYAVYPWMTHFEEAVDFLRQNEKLN